MECIESLHLFYTYTCIYSSLELSNFLFFTFLYGGIYFDTTEFFILLYNLRNANIYKSIKGNIMNNMDVFEVINA